MSLKILDKKHHRLIVKERGKEKYSFHTCPKCNEPLHNTLVEGKGVQLKCWRCK